MNRPVHSQLEIFSEAGNNALSEQSSRGSLAEYFGRYEKAILVAIALIITGTVSFCLGIEKGRKGGHTAAAPAAAVSTQKVSPPVPPPVISQPSKVKEKEPPRELVLKAQPLPGERQVNTQLQGGFTIQLATFQSRSYAQKAADGLKKRGLSPLVIPKGEYTILCVGNFSTKNRAASVLPEFKKKYRDCYIRRL